MSLARFPDPDRSRAVLIGTSHFTAAGQDLPDIPAVKANLTDLRQALTSPDTGVLRPEFCRVLIDPTSADEIGTALSDMAASATDLLLVYCAGHGLVDDNGRLHLTLAHTQPHRARWTALSLDLLREEIANSAAATRVLVLDCCFSGRAIEAMADDQAVISGQLHMAGTYTLTSTTANAPSHAPTGDRHTAFTGALLHALDEIDPLTLLSAFEKNGEVLVRKLTVNWSDITIIRQNHTRTRLAWRDIEQIGVLQPERGALNRYLPSSQYTRKHVLVVRLRPTVPAPSSVVSVLSDEHRQLGYLGLCAVEELGSSQQEMINELERFAGGKLIYSPRQFLDRDPQLRPEMV